MRQPSCDPKVLDVIQAIRAVSHLLAEASAAELAVGRLLQLICEQFDFQAAAIWLLEGDGSQLRCFDVWSQPGLSLAEFKASTREHAFGPGRGLVGRVWFTGSSCWIEDIETEPEFERRAVALKEGLRSAGFFPIWIEGKLVGILEMCRTTRGPLEMVQEQVIETICDQVGLFLDRKRLEENVVWSQARYRALFEANLDGILVLNEEGEIIDLNESLSSILEKPKSELLGKNFEEFLTGADIPRVRKEFRELPEQKFLKGDLRIRGGVSMIDVEWNCRAQFLPGLHLCVVRKKSRPDQVFAEVQEAQLEARALNRQLESHVKQRTAELRESNQELEAFCYTVSHDLRAPLRAMQGFSRALIDDCWEALGPLGQDFAHRIEAAAERMDRLLQDLIEFGRIGRMEVRLAPVELGPLLETVLARFGREIKSREAVIDVHGAMPAVCAHAAILQEVLCSIISNALKFVAAETRPKVLIWAERADELVRVSVQDNGIGIDPAHQEKIFRLFERLHGQEAYAGTGLGLALAHKGMARMGGSIGVHSALGEGSCFWLELPAVG